MRPPPSIPPSTAMRPPPSSSSAMRPPPSSSSSAGRHGQGARNLVKTASVPAHGTTPARGRPLATGGGLTAAPVASLSTPTLPLTDSGVAAPLNSGHDKIASAPAHGASTSASRALAVDHGVPCFGDDDHGDVEGAYFLSGDFAASMAIGAASALSGAHKTTSVPAHGTTLARGRPLATGGGLTAAPVASLSTPTLPLTDSGAAAPFDSGHDKIASAPAHGATSSRGRPLATDASSTAFPVSTPPLTTSTKPPAAACLPIQTVTSAASGLPSTSLVASMLPKPGCKPPPSYSPSPRVSPEFESRGQTSPPATASMLMAASGSATISVSRAQEPSRLPPPRDTGSGTVPTAEPSQSYTYVTGR
jgi:hypothetical protein